MDHDDAQTEFCAEYAHNGAAWGRTPYWETYFEGVIRRHDDTPSDIVDICEMWRDGKRCPMHAFWQGRAIKPMALANAASKALSMNNQGGEEDARLRRLSIWSLREHQMCVAAAALREATAAFSEATEAIGMDAYESHRMRETAVRTI